MLKQVERGELTEQAFMAGLRELTTGLVQEHTAPDPAFTALFGSENTSPSIGSCPRCGGAVRERQKGFFCEPILLDKEKESEQNNGSSIAEGRACCCFRAVQ